MIFICICTFVISKLRNYLIDFDGTFTDYYAYDLPNAIFSFRSYRRYRLDKIRKLRNSKYPIEMSLNIKVRIGGRLSGGA